jgi:hypothetical protein
METHGQEAASASSLVHTGAQGRDRRDGPRPCSRHGDLANVYPFIDAGKQGGRAGGPGNVARVCVLLKVSLRIGPSAYYADGTRRRCSSRLRLPTGRICRSWFPSSALSPSPSSADFRTGSTSPILGVESGSRYCQRCARPPRIAGSGRGRRRSFLRAHFRGPRRPGGHARAAARGDSCGPRGCGGLSALVVGTACRRRRTSSAPGSFRSFAGGGRRRPCGGSGCWRADPALSPAVAGISRRLLRGLPARSRREQRGSSPPLALRRLTSPTADR